MVWDCIFKMTDIDNNLNEKQKSMGYADKRRAEKKDALREFITAKQYLNAIDRDLERDILPDELQTVKFKTETRLKLLNKILPDLKAVEHSGGIDGEIIISTIERKIVDTANTNT